MTQGKSLQENQTEEWRTIEGFENYAVNNKGKVMRYGYVKKTPLGHPFYHEPKLLKSNSSLRRGYPCVSLYGDSGHKVVPVHRLVAQAFIPNPKNMPEVNHKDGVRTNSNASNLEWCTRAENIQHALDTGLIKTGCAHKLSILTADQVRDIRMNCITSKRGYSQMDFARKYGVSRGCIKDVLYGRTYKYGEACAL